ncbi:putative Carbon catabolite-derepressing protein kinase [Blattamonas nauphoetae]|uniref:non-specific serine/threonine protein kinase n=1 Tax=Blattamonas nauphoetae TaxID=2049346 RepID=A0ABQ9X0P2_9EUKA|nr:putative Carbon catabolite-derepressing protein kinase [Blattamonas nauphoetae]
MTTNLDKMIPSGYTLVRPISEGAFGRVLEIKELSTGQSYALKLIPRLMEADQKRAEREVSLLEGFRHARIVGLHRSVVMETYHGIVMDLGKRNLKDLMLHFESRNELIPLEVAVQISMDIAEGLCVMHTHTTYPTAHGDLKPENVLLTDDDRAMLCASGLNTSHSTKDFQPSEYSSPERLNDKTHRGTPRSDIWSLGVIIHRMVAGEPLFVGESLSEMIRAISKSNTSEISTSLDPAVRDVLVRLLDPNPDSRPSSTELFKDRLLERMLGPETPLSKMKDRQIQLLEKKLVNLIEEKRDEREADGGVEKKAHKDTQATSHDLSESVERVENDEMDGLKQQLADLPIWVGTESLQTLDRTVHVLTPTTLTQIAKLEKEWRTAFTFPIDEGEWELKIRFTKPTGWNVLISFIQHPLPKDATQFTCGSWNGGIGGHFVLWDGGMWKAGKEFKPAGTNKKCSTIGQTAAIRVNLWTKEARLFVDEEEQPGFFTDIPSQLCLGISTAFTKEYQSVEVMWLKLRRGNDFWESHSRISTLMKTVLNYNSSSKMTSTDESTIFNSLVALVKQGYRFDSALQDRAVHPLAEALTTDLVPSSNKSPSGFVESIVTLLTSPNSPVFAETLKFLFETTEEIRTGIGYRFVASDLIAQVFTAVKPQTRPTSGNEAIHYRLVKIINNVVIIADPDWFRHIPTGPVDKSNHNEVIFQRAVIPSSQYVTFLISNRYILTGNLIDSFVLANSFGDWKRKYFGEHQSGGQIIKALIVEGFEDTVDQMWMFDKKGHVGQQMIFPEHSHISSEPQSNTTNQKLNENEHFTIPEGKYVVNNMEITQRSVAVPGQLPLE